MTDETADQGKTDATGSNPDLDVGLHLKGAAPAAPFPVGGASAKMPSIGIPQDFKAPETASTPLPPAAPTPAPATAIDPASQAPKNTPSAVQTPAAESLPPITTAKSPSDSINTDIEKILRQVKLPERRDFRAVADTKAPAPDTENPADAMTVKPPTAAEVAVAERAASGEDRALASVHTLKDDLQHAVKEKKISLVRAVALEQDKKRDDAEFQEEFGRAERRKRVFGILFASFLLIGLGTAALFGVYFVMLGHAGTETQQLNSIVFAEQSVALPLDSVTPSELKRRIAATRQTQIGSLGSITRIVPLTQGIAANGQPAQQLPATTEEFFSAIGANAPQDLLRSVGSEFFFGLHVVDKNSPVLVIPITSYDRAFAGMLAWENTMNADLSPAFTPVPATKLDSNGIPSQRIFIDDVMRNYDVRELKDDAGQVQLYYSFPSPKLLIISESPYSFPELLSRLQSVRRL